jgi:hypothetical protein
VGDLVLLRLVHLSKSMRVSRDHRLISEFNLRLALILEDGIPSYSHVSMYYVYPFLNTYRSREAHGEAQSCPASHVSTARLKDSRITYRATALEENDLLARTSTVTKSANSLSGLISVSSQQVVQALMTNRSHKPLALQPSAFIFSSVFSSYLTCMLQEDRSERYSTELYLQPGRGLSPVHYC